MACICCKRIKSYDDFYHSPTKTNNRCKRCILFYQVGRIAMINLGNKPEVMYGRKGSGNFYLLNRVKQFEEVLGITVIGFQDRLEQLAGVCSSCKKPAKLYADHDHVTGKFRDFICSKCNLIIGQLNDDLTSVLAIAAYLAQHQQRTKHATNIRKLRRQVKLVS